MWFELTAVLSLSSGNLDVVHDLLNDLPMALRRLAGGQVADLLVVCYDVALLDLSTDNTCMVSGLDRNSV